jgi:hypothetical protein
MNRTANETLDLGNNESASRGVFAQPDGTFLALSFMRSATFKTRGGAERWFARATRAATPCVTCGEISLIGRPALVCSCGTVRR